MLSQLVVQYRWTLTFVVFSFAVACEAKVDATPYVVPFGSVIRLFNGRNLDGLYTFLEDTKYNDPREVFTVRDGVLMISGDGYGGVSTRESYANYHLVCEFKWGGKTWGLRKDRARDSGILVHGNGPDGAFAGRWMTSIEAQIIDGGLGDIIVVNGEHSGNTRDISVTSEVTTDRDGEPVWKKGGPKRTFHEGRINWSRRDEDWTDTLGFRGTRDFADPLSDWTRMDVICDRSSIRVFVDGVLVNEAADLVPSSGKITLQAEGAEIHVRRWELHPLGSLGDETTLTDRQ